MVAGRSATDGCVTDEGRPLLHLRVQEPVQVERRVLLPCELGARQQCDAEGADGAGVGRDDDFAARLTHNSGGECVGGKGMP